MKVCNNTYSPSFNGGLTKQMQSEIKHCDVKKITSELAKMGVESDFKNNKTIAWCSYKCAEIFKKLNLSLPNGIYVEDFRTIDVKEPTAVGFNNILPTKLYFDSDKITQEKTLFFNSYSEFDQVLEGKTYWSEIDLISDYEHCSNISPTDHFMYHFTHEFVHSAHEDLILRLRGVKKAVEYFLTNFDTKYIEEFQRKYGNILNEICSYASVNPNESIACDLGRRIADNLDDSLDVQPKLLEKSPYKELTIKEKLFGLSNKKDLDSILRKIWFGNIP